MGFPDQGPNLALFWEHGLLASGSPELVSKGVPELGLSGTVNPNLCLHLLRGHLPSVCLCARFSL